MSEDRKEQKQEAAAAKARVKAGRNWYQKKRFILPLGLVLLIAVVSVVSAGDDAATPTSDSDAATDDAASDTLPDDAPEEVPGEAEFAGIGEEARDGDFAFTVNNFECVGDVLESDNDFIDPAEAQGQFCILDIVVENIGSSAQSLSASNQYLYDADERRFSADSSFDVIMVTDTPIFDSINPGNSLQGQVVFDVPIDATIEFAELHDSAFSGGVLVDLR